MKKADSAHRASCKQARTLANDPRDSNPLLAYLISCQNATIGQFAVKLQELDSENFAYPVEDATGIPDRFDFTLSFHPGVPVAGRPGGPESFRAKRRDLT